MSKTDKNQLLAKNLIKQALEMWINPELEKRRTSGDLPDDFVLRGAQIIFSIGDFPVVRLNNEVKAVIEAKINKDVEKGDLIYQKDVDDIKSFSLTEEEKDFGHITIVKLTQGWFVGFSFIYDVTKSKEFYDIALDFLGSAKDSLQAERDWSLRDRSFVASAYVAAENLAKARLYLLPDKEIRGAEGKGSKTHGTVHGKINIYSKTSNIIKTSYKDAFNKLSNIRDRARYDSNFDLDRHEGENILQALEDLKKEVFHYLVRFGEKNKKNKGV